MVLIIIVTIVFVFLIILFRDYLERNNVPSDLIITIILVAITAIYVNYTRDLSETAQDQINLQREQFQKQISLQREQFQKQIEMQSKQSQEQIQLQTEQFQKQIRLQTEQFQVNSRPNVYISGWGEFKYYPEFKTIQFKLENVGKLPAIFEEMNYSIIIRDRTIDIKSSDFKKPSVIFPGQKNMYVDLPIPNLLISNIVENRGFKIKFYFTYYSINDKKKKDMFSYFVKYDLRMKKDSNDIDEYIFMESKAE